MTHDDMELRVPRPLQDAWSDLAAKLQASAASVAEVVSEDEAAEGYLHLLRLVSAGIDLQVERSDPHHPSFTVWMTPTRKFLGDNPDTIYTTAPIDGTGSYSLHVAPGNALYLGVVLYGRSPSGWRVIGSVSDTELVAAEDGTYTVSLGPDAASSANELQTAPDAHWVMVREYFADRHDKHPAQLRIERHSDDPMVPVQETGVAERIDRLGTWVSAQIDADVFLSSMQLASPNQAPDVANVTFPEELVATFLPTPDIDYQGCGFELQPGQRLLVRGIAPHARYWGLQVMNRWLESVDGRSGWNGFELGVAPGEPFSIMLADEDVPGTVCIPLQGRRSGLLAFRTLLPTGEVPRLTFEVLDER